MFWRFKLLALNIFSSFEKEREGERDDQSEMERYNEKEMYSIMSGTTLLQTYL